MGREITLVVKSVTGRVRYYPVGENAKHVLQLTGKKTLSELDVEALKALGCEVRRVEEGSEEARAAGASGAAPPEPPPEKPKKKGWW